MSETKEEKVLGEQETIRIGFDDREEFLVISGNGNMSIDHGTHGSNVNLFEYLGQTSNNAQYNAMQNTGWENFKKQSQYLDMLIKVNNSGHKVHDEIDESLKKLKEITYQ